MLELELFAFLEQTADAAYTGTTSGEICSWNAAAVHLFGYPAEDVLGRNIDEVLDARDALGTDALAGGQEAATRQWKGHTPRIPHFDLDVRAQSGARLWINVSSIIYVNPRTGRRLFARLARDVTTHRKKAELFGRLGEVARQVVTIAEDASAHAPVDALSDQELRILRLFANGGNTADVATELSISPQTLRNHLHHINRKLRTHSRLEAVTHARRRGLLD